MSDLTTKYLGLTLKSPLVASASPLCESVDNIKKLEDHNLAAVVLPSLFEEHLELIRHAKESVDIPIIASLNGTSSGGWLQYARLMEEAGADAIELNIYSIETDPVVSAGEIEQGYIDLVRHLKRTVRIPLAVKLSPFFSAPANMGVRLDEARVDGIVLFNRFYQPDFDIDEREVSPNLALSRPEELLLRLHWTAILCGHVRADLGITGGVHSSRDVIKCVLAGAKVAFMTSALLRNGVQHAAHVLTEVNRWLDDHDYESVREMCGSMSHGAVPDPSAFERGNYMKVLSSYTLRANVFND